MKVVQGSDGSHRTRPNSRSPSPSGSKGHRGASAATGEPHLPGVVGPTTKAEAVSGATSAPTRARQERRRVFTMFSLLGPGDEARVMRPGCAFPRLTPIKSNLWATRGFAGGARRSCPVNRTGLRGDMVRKGQSHQSMCKELGSFDSVTLTDTPRRVDCRPRGPRRPTELASRGIPPQIASGSHPPPAQHTLVLALELQQFQAASRAGRSAAARALAAFDQHCNALDNMTRAITSEINGRCKRRSRCQ